MSLRFASAVVAAGAVAAAAGSAGAIEGNCGEGACAATEEQSVLLQYHAVNTHDFANDHQLEDEEGSEGPWFAPGPRGCKRISSKLIRGAVHKAKAEQLNGMTEEDTDNLATCLFSQCLNFLNPRREENCWECLESWMKGWSLMNEKIGVNSVPIGYVADMVRIPLNSMLFDTGANTYEEIVCRGKMAGCKRKFNFPGPNTTTMVDWQSVWKTGAQYPKKTWSGEWWRGNELGFLILDPFDWSLPATRTEPIGIYMGALASQHVAVRPFIEKLFQTPGKSTLEYKQREESIKQAIEAFLSSRTEIKIPDDLSAFVHQLLSKIIFDSEVGWEEAQEFVQTQQTHVMLSTLGQVMPEALYPFLSGLKAGVSKYVTLYTGLVDKMFGPKLAKEDCSPTKSCALQLGSAVWDTMSTAGGLSVPSTMGAGLAVLYSEAANNPFPQGTYPKEKALNFYWESVRFFAPVFGFPYWEKRPTCAGETEEATDALNKPNGATEACPTQSDNWATGFPKMNQYQGGIRKVPALALAQRDPAKWGKDASEFKIRAITDYIRNSVGFAEMAVDNSVEGGRNNRDCPGKDFALMIGHAFFKAFDKAAWKVKGNATEIVFKSGPTYHAGFTLVKV